MLSLVLIPRTSAQSPDQRAAIVKLRDSLGIVADVSGLERLRDRELKHGGELITRLKVGTILQRLGELTGQRQRLDEALMQFAEVARAEPGWPEGWYGLALAKLELHDQGFPSKDGPFSEPDQTISMGRRIAS